MTLSSEELEILEYLKSWNGKPVNMVEICRCAGGRKKFRETPNWAKPLMARLVEAKIVTVNERGHYQCGVEAAAPKPVSPFANAVKKAKTAVIVGDDYFPVLDELTDISAPPPAQRYLSPQMAAILNKAGKKA